MKLYTVFPKNQVVFAYLFALFCIFVRIYNRNMHFKVYFMQILNILLNKYASGGITRIFRGTPTAQNALDLRVGRGDFPIGENVAKRQKGNGVAATCPRRWVCVKSDCARAHNAHPYDL